MSGIDFPQYFVITLAVISAVAVTVQYNAYLRWYKKTDNSSPQQYCTFNESALTPPA